VSNPAFQLIGTRFASSGAFGTSAFGTAPFGGWSYVPQELPTFHLGTDVLSAVRTRNVAEIVLGRYGQTVSVRPLAEWGLWRVNYALIIAADLDRLLPYFTARVFRLLPTGEPSNYTTVRWQESSFLPTPIGAGNYSFSFTIEEVPA